MNNLSKFKNKYKISSTRLSGYNYLNNGMYFVTICTKNKEEFFGKIRNKKIILNETGNIAEKYWLEIPKHFLFVKLDEFVVMPNHIHGIIEIINNFFDSNVETQQCCVSTGVINKKSSNTFYKLKPGSLSVIIRSYKSIVTKNVNQYFSNVGFQWQSRFYDRIIRNEKELNRIREYIRINPKNWENEKMIFD